VDTAGNVSRARSTTVRIGADVPTALNTRPATARPGAYQAFTLKGFHRYTTVDLALGSLRLGSVTTDVNGNGTTTVRIPADTNPGTCTVTAAEPDGGLSATATVKVTG
jgi:hypothetical protein